MLQAEAEIKAALAEIDEIDRTVQSPDFANRFVNNDTLWKYGWPECQRRMWSEFYQLVGRKAELLDWIIDIGEAAEARLLELENQT